QGLGNANADVGSLAFVTTPNGRYKLKTTEKASGTGRYLWDDEAGPLGYPAYATKNLPSNLVHGSGTGLSPIVFGNFQDLAIGMWGPVDILVDPYRFTTAGYVRIRALQDMDVNLRHLTSFVVVPDMVTT
ncbi:phage major capsid protein, partial [Singulisphaera rosea]